MTCRLPCVKRLAAGGQWSDHDLVFSARTGGALDAANVRPEFRAVYKAAGIGENWTPRELRHSFVSLMSSSGVSLEEAARPAGHSNTRTSRWSTGASCTPDPDHRSRYHGQAVPKLTDPRARHSEAAHQIWSQGVISHPDGNRACNRLDWSNLLGCRTTPRLVPGMSRQLPPGVIGSGDRPGSGCLFPMSCRRG